MRPNLATGQHSTNSLGLRGPEIPPKRPHEFRILSLGESTTYGWRVPYEACYTARVEHALDSERDGSVRLINAGVPGYSVFQGRVWLERDGVDLAPDAALLYFGLNDFLPVAFRDKREAQDRGRAHGLTDRELFAQRQRASARLVGRMFEWSNLARRLGAAIDNASTAGTPTTESSAGGTQAVRVPDDDRWESLVAMHRLCVQQSIDLVVVIPWYRDFEAHAPLLREFAGRHGLPVVDLPAALEALPHPKAAYFQDAAHPNAEGHARIAQAILDAVRARWADRIRARSLTAS